MISVVTNTFNSSKFIYRLYSSLINQTYKDFEWIIVDDYSSDNTLEILLKLKSPGFKGLKIYRIPFNSGGSIVASIGAMKTTQKIVVRIDHDDELLPNALSSIKNNFDKIFKQKKVAGILFPSIQNDTSKKISSLKNGQFFKYSYFMSKEKESVDGVLALKGELARYFFGLEFYNRTILNGALMLEISKDYLFQYVGGEPIMNYFRDNKESQSNRLRVSNKLVYSFARILDYHDIYYYTNPLKWTRYTLALFHFTITYYGSPFAIFKFISRWSTKFWCALFLPFGMVAHLIKPKLETTFYSEMKFSSFMKLAKEIKNIPYNKISKKINL